MAEMILNDLNPEEMARCKYCDEPCDPYKTPALQCKGQCARKIHLHCLKQGVPGSLLGDVFFDLVCSECSELQNEEITRAKMSWVKVLVLTLHNLREKSSGISTCGYFHFSSHIKAFIERNWDCFSLKHMKKTKNWVGTVAGALSHNSSSFFKSGTTDLNARGWWKLIGSDPPEILMAKRSTTLNKLHQSPTRSESSLSFGDDISNCGGESRVQTPSMFSREYVRPSEMLSDLLLADDDMPDIDLLDMDDNLVCDDQSFVDYENNSCELFPSTNPQLSPLLKAFNSDWIENSVRYDGNNELTEGEEINMDQEGQYDEENSNDSSITAREPPLSLFTSKARRDWPWRRKTNVARRKRPPMSKQEEEYLLHTVNSTDLDSVTPAARRLYRKLAVRKAKRDNHLIPFDLDHFCSKLGQGKINKGEKRVIDRFFNDHSSVVFEQRLQGCCEPTAVHSPYTNRLLQPFIRRDTSCRPLWLRVMDELRAKVNRNHVDWQPEESAPIDYCYVRPHHIPAVNSLCRQFFWPGVDLTECLQYPDFTCVALYKKLVIGFAALVPDVAYNEAYISFFVTRPEWRRSGIGTYMLYHLFQTCMGYHITLHVSVTNPAVILYQKFGFKIEEFVQDFYDKYMSSRSKESRHALFLRLSP